MICSLVADGVTVVKARIMFECSWAKLFLRCIRACSEKMWLLLRFPALQLAQVYFLAFSSFSLHHIYCKLYLPSPITDWSSWRMVPRYLFTSRLCVCWVHYI